MREERLKVLTMLQEGKITAEEAERLLAALSGGERAEPGEGPGRGRRGHGFWDFDFGEFRRFGPVFDDEFRRKFQDKMRGFRHSMRRADEESRREAQEAFRGAAEAVKEAIDRSHIKETVESIGKTVLDAMEEAMGRFGSSAASRPESPEEPCKPEEPSRPEEPRKPDGGDERTTYQA
jgi:hypothetical protein